MCFYTGVEIFSNISCAVSGVNVSCGLQVNFNIIWLVQDHHHEYIWNINEMFFFIYNCHKIKIMMVQKKSMMKQQTNKISLKYFLNPSFRYIRQFCVALPFYNYEELHSDLHQWPHSVTFCRIFCIFTLLGVSNNIHKVLFSQELSCLNAIIFSLQKRVICHLAKLHKCLPINRNS